jgi:hypothetical protein
MQLLLRALRLIAPTHDGDLRQDELLQNVRSLSRDESFQSLPKLKVFALQIRLSLSAMHQLGQSREDPINVRRQRHRFEYHLDGDRVVRIPQLHHEERQVLDRQRQVNDLHLQHQLVRQSEALR